MRAYGGAVWIGRAGRTTAVAVAVTGGAIPWYPCVGQVGHCCTRVWRQVHHRFRPLARIISHNIISQYYTGDRGDILLSRHVTDGPFAPLRIARAPSSKSVLFSSRRFACFVFFRFRFWFFCRRLPRFSRFPSDVFVCVRVLVTYDAPSDCRRRRDTTKLKLRKKK